MAYLRIEPLGAYDADIARTTVSELIDASELEWRGKTVLVKPNLLGPFTPESAVVTHPTIIKALREGLRDRGCTVLVGDNPGVRGYGMMGRTAEVSGAGEAAADDFVNLSLRPRKVPVESIHTDSLSVCSEIFEVDLFVSVPKFKTHMSTVITGAIKNSYGLLVAAEKARLHAVAPRPDDFGELLVDIYSIRPPDLVIMDAVTGMEGNGPSAGKSRDIGYILSSDSGGAMDLAMCHMMGINPSRVASQRVATSRGLAPADLDDVRIHGELPVIPHFKAPSTLVRFDPWGIGQRLIFRQISRPHMKVDRGLCDACGSCVRACPVDAIVLKDRPTFDHNACIACYCCYELCPRSAIKVGNVLHFLRGR
jgi:uncharacterized protein (DUF362 family)/NAD-dependent dihydropyrimidine dehydrogenase PreA subunit